MNEPAPVTSTNVQVSVDMKSPLERTLTPQVGRAETEEEVDEETDEERDEAEEEAGTDDEMEIEEMEETEDGTVDKTEDDTEDDTGEGLQTEARTLPGPSRPRARTEMARMVEVC